jgi:DNA primase
MASAYRKMAKLIEICYDQLPKNKVVQEYLKKRKIGKNTIDRFYLGAFPADLRVLLKEFDAEFLKKNGILYQADKSPFQFYPLIIPIWDANDNFIGIGGRTLMPERQLKSLGYPKYKNSQYDKRNHLFGLNYAKSEIRNKNTAIVVEGYFDVISSHQAGITNVVSTSGTFLSLKQTMLLSRYCEDIKILFDNDDAGKKAATKFIDRCKAGGIRLKELFLPDGYKDIDEYIVNSKDVKIDFL